MVEVEGVTRVYGRGKKALAGVNLRCGSGKTTLMRIVATLLPPTTGTVRVGGFDVRRQPFEVRRLIGYLPQEYGIYRRLTAPEFLEYIAALKGMSGRRARDGIGGIFWRGPAGRKGVLVEERSDGGKRLCAGPV